MATSHRNLWDCDKCSAKLLVEDPLDWAVGFWGHWNQADLAANRQVIFKSIVSIVIVGGLLAKAACNQEPLGTIPDASRLRAVGQCILALVALVQLGYHLFGLPPVQISIAPGKLQVLGGNSIFITYWDLAFQTVCMIGSAVAELSLFSIYPSSGLLTMCYRTAVLVAGFGVCRGFHFWLNNWCSRLWQQNVREHWESYNWPLGQNAILGNCPSLALSVADLLLKDPAYLRHTTPPLGSCLSSTAVFVWFYACWCQLLYVGSGLWPSVLIRRESTIQQRLSLVTYTAITRGLVMLLVYGFAAIVWAGH